MGIAARALDPHSGPAGVGIILVLEQHTVYVGGLRAARAADSSPSYPLAALNFIKEGSATVFFAGKHAARMGDKTADEGTITGGWPTVFIGGGTTVILNPLK